MTLEEIKARSAAFWVHCEDQQARFFALHAWVLEQKEKYGVTLLEFLPDETQRIIEERAAGLKTPGELSAELAEIDRELKSYCVVYELHKLYGMVDPRPG
jgi:hypothetical protein